MNPPRLTAPAADTPETNKQLDTLRPTLTVRNGTSDQAGTRTYEFQISDNAEFTTAGSRAARGYRVVVTKTGVPEGQRHDQLHARRGSAADHEALLAGAR